MFPENFELEQDETALESWLDTHLGNEVFSPSPERLGKYFSSFKKGFKEKEIPIFIIAGTNGKGEVALGLERVLYKNGFHPYLWMSPHIVSVRERFSKNGLPINGKELLNLFDEFKELSTELSYYEFLFYCFCQWVKRTVGDSNKPVLIFEVGLGGRLDATNYFDAGYSALVSIGRDHMDILGPTLSHVLKEKAAVGRRHCIMISAVSQDVLKKELAQYCKEQEIDLKQIGPFDPTKNDFKAVNHAVVKALSLEFFKKELAAKEFQKVQSDPELLAIENLWARPFEVTYKSTQFILVGSHNLDGLRHLANWVNGQRRSDSCGSDFDEVWVGMSRKPGKELDQCLKLIAKSPCLGNEVVLFDYEHPRATSLEDMKKSWLEFNHGRKVRFEKSWQNNLHSNEGSKRILVCGSYYFVGELLKQGPFFKSS